MRRSISSVPVLGFALAVFMGCAQQQLLAQSTVSVASNVASGGNSDETTEERCLRFASQIPVEDRSPYVDGCHRDPFATLDKLNVVFSAKGPSVPGTYRAAIVRPGPDHSGETPEQRCVRFASQMANAPDWIAFCHHAHGQSTMPAAGGASKVAVTDALQGYWYDVKGEGSQTFDVEFSIHGNRIKFTHCKASTFKVTGASLNPRYKRTTDITIRFNPKKGSCSFNPSFPEPPEEAISESSSEITFEVGDWAADKEIDYADLIFKLDSIPSSPNYSVGGPFGHLNKVIAQTHLEACLVAAEASYTVNWNRRCADTAARNAQMMLPCRASGKDEATCRSIWPNVPTRACLLPGSDAEWVKATQNDAEGTCHGQYLSESQ